MTFIIRTLHAGVRLKNNKTQIGTSLNAKDQDAFATFLQLYLSKVEWNISKRLQI
jgi:hypothetical protein